MGPNQTEKFLQSKGTLNKMKRQPTEWENIFASESTDKALISKTYKHLLNLHTKKTNNPIQKRAEDLNGLSPKKTYKWPKDT